MKYLKLKTSNFRPELDDHTCIKINIKSYVYSTLAIIKVFIYYICWLYFKLIKSIGGRETLCFHFVKEFNIIDKDIIGSLFDKKVLLNW